MIAKGSKEAPSSGNPRELGAPSLPSSYEPSHVIQLLIEAQRETAAHAAKLDRLIEDVKENGDKLDDVRQKIARSEGFGIAAVVLFAVFGAVLWWFIGGQISQLRDQLYVMPPTLSLASPEEVPKP